MADTPQGVVLWCTSTRDLIINLASRLAVDSPVHSEYVISLLDRLPEETLNRTVNA